MELMRSIVTEVRDFYHGINQATLSGAIDILVVRQPDGTLKGSPFHVRFGKLSVLRPRERVVHIKINGEPVDVIQMKVGGLGECFFVVETEEEMPERLCTSPLPSPTSTRRGLQYRDSDLGNSEPNSLNASIDMEDEESMRSDDDIQSETDLEATGKGDSILEWNWGDLPVSEREQSEATKNLWYSRIGKMLFHSHKPADQKGVYLSDLAPKDMESMLDSTPTPDSTGQGRSRQSSTSSSSDDDREMVGIEAASNSTSTSTLKTTRSQSDSAQYLSTSLPNTGLSHTQSDLSAGRPIPYSYRLPSPGSPCARMSLCGWKVKAGNDEELWADFVKHEVSFEKFSEDPTSFINNPSLVIRLGEEYMSWGVAAPTILSYLMYGQPLPGKTEETLREKYTPKKPKSGWFWWGQQTGSASNQVKPPHHQRKKKEEFKKETRLTSDQLKLLNLKEGDNEVEFTVITRLQGTSTVKCHLYLWDWKERLIISDIDGTITKSDVIGHAAGFIGRDWTHEGVAELYSAIAKNGYKFVYLSSRSVSYSGATKFFIQGLQQNRHSLPDGPVFLSPSSFMDSIKTEVITRKPEVFKIKCLKEIASFFPQDAPFYAGFGNRHTDEVSYLAVNVFSPRIFIINKNGLVKCCHGSYKSSYTDIRKLVDHWFPPFDKPTDEDNEIEEEEFGSFNFWRSEPEPIDPALLLEVSSQK